MGWDIATRNALPCITSNFNKRERARIHYPVPARSRMRIHTLVPLKAARVHWHSVLSCSHTFSAAPGSREIRLEYTSERRSKSANFGHRSQSLAGHLPRSRVWTTRKRSTEFRTARDLGRLTHVQRALLSMFRVLSASAGDTQNIDIIGDGSESPTSSTHSAQVKMASGRAKKRKLAHFQQNFFGRSIYSAIRAEQPREFYLNSRIFVTFFTSERFVPTHSPAYVRLNALGCGAADNFMLSLFDHM